MNEHMSGYHFLVDLRRLPVRWARGEESTGLGFIQEEEALRCPQDAVFVLWNFGSGGFSFGPR